MIMIERFDAWLWQDRTSSAGWVRALNRAARIARKVVDDMVAGDLPLYAMSLVYTTLLSIVPVLAVSFSVLKAFGVHNQLEPLLLNVLQPLGAKGPEITATVIGFVDNIRVGVLGALGTGLLVYTVISLMQKIEAAFNRIWHASGQRSFSRRFSDYLSVILVGPVLVFAALGITGTLMSSDAMQWLAAHEPAKTIVPIVARLVPYALVIVAFAFVYKLIPYTKVTVIAALVGGLVAGVLWETAGLAFASFIATSAKYTAVYSGFALLILTMIWLYLAWLILLIGASIGFYYQHAEHLNLESGPALLLGAERERAALTVMLLIGRAHQGEQEDERITLQRLIDVTKLPQEALCDLIDELHEARLLVRSDDEPPAWYPARAIEQIKIKQILDVARGVDASTSRKAAGPDPVSNVIRRADKAVTDALESVTLKDLITAG